MHHPRRPTQDQILAVALAGITLAAGLIALSFLTS